MFSNSPPKNPSLSLSACLFGSLAFSRPQKETEKHPSSSSPKSQIQESNHACHTTAFSISRAFHSPMELSLAWSIGGDRRSSPSMAARVTRVLSSSKSHGGATFGRRGDSSSLALGDRHSPLGHASLGLAMPHFYGPTATML
jgi:hypothetical protein